MKFLLLCVILTVIKSDEILEFQNSNVEFAADLYKEISAKQADNFLVCPLSAQIILSLATVGSRDSSAEQLSSCLHLPNDPMKIQGIFGKVNDKFNVSQPYQFSSANKIYLGDKSAIKNDYRDIAINTFKAGIENVNFDDREQATKIINQWVENKTNNKIKDIIEKISLSPSTYAILVNALYFHGNWIHEFDGNGDYKHEFYVSETEIVSTNFMFQRNNFNYCYNEKLRAEFLELPFVGDDVTMTIALPKSNHGLNELENHISDVILPQSFQKLDAFISIPKFTMASTIDLKKILKVLGVTDPFNTKANFKGITEAPIYIDEVVQKTFIEINEKGTTAAAATKISFGSISMPLVTFTADHPFIYYLRHRTTGIVFIGRFSRP
ncbi:leukocyte elastase inhibitor-like [Photinus pyralis]|uniref:leukocyte elastase inhibitor-like n=1 Tax=Photinus pyralis TaxID=7054 RepID=UPI001266F421|nr:leukocyte elastase inhibitor-like [Photinus pyralis]